MPRDYRTGTITIDQARRRFNEYYEKKSKTPIGLFRAKLFDMMYQKKPANLIKCNQITGICEKGSIKYMLEEGPKTFDVEGVDAFPEGDEFEVELPGGEIRKYTSKGYEKTLSTDDALKPVYGPRLNAGKELYSKHFRDKYKVRTGKNLVDIYWDNYNREKAAGVISDKWRRKNKTVGQTKPKVLFEFTIGTDTYGYADSLEYEGVSHTKKYKLVSIDKEVVLQSAGETLPRTGLEYLIQIDFLRKLKILAEEGEVDGVLEFKKKTPTPKMFKLLCTRGDLKNKDPGKNLELVLNIKTGKITSDVLGKTSIPIMDFWERYEYAEDIECQSIEEISDLPKDMAGGGSAYIYNVESRLSSSEDEYSIEYSDFE